jgi:hypothetical protein
MDPTLDWTALPQYNEGLSRLGKMRVVLVPVAFTTHERSHKLCTLGCGKKGRELRQSPFSFCSSKGTYEEAVRGQFGTPGTRGLGLWEPLNGPPVFIRALADIVAQNLKENDASAPPNIMQFGVRRFGFLYATRVQRKSFST